MRLCLALERKIAPLLDQSARDRLGEGPLRQAEIERLALALVAAFALVIANLIVDILYAFVDPRVRLS